MGFTVVVLRILIQSESEATRLLCRSSGSREKGHFERLEMI